MCSRGCGCLYSAALGVVLFCNFITFELRCLASERPIVGNVGLLLWWGSVVLRRGQCGMRYFGDL